jgi:hypothetical protein
LQPQRLGHIESLFLYIPYTLVYDCLEQTKNKCNTKCKKSEYIKYVNSKLEFNF